MKRAWAAAALLAGMAATAGAAEPVVNSRCKLGDRGVMLVRWGKANTQPPPPPLEGIGDPNGSHQPWEWPNSEPPPIGPSGALPTPGGSFQTLWTLGATADFNGDGTCDLAWTSDAPHARLLKVRITTGTPPRFESPDDGSFEEIPVDWRLVGSGDFVGPFVGGPRGVPPPRDGRSDLLFWEPTLRHLMVWASDGHGGFPDDERYTLMGPAEGVEPVVTANVDGSASPEIIWRNVAGQLSLSRIDRVGEGLTHQMGGLLVPAQPAQQHWHLRAADDFDGDGRDDLLFQNTTSEKTVIWYMNGHERVTGLFTEPQRLVEGPENPNPERPWEIVGPR